MGITDSSINSILNLSELSQQSRQNSTMAPKVAIVFYSMYGHIKALAEAEKAGLAKAGIEADIFQVAETLPQEVLTKIHAPPKSDYPVIDAAKLEEYDAFLFGIPTRYGNFPAQWKALGYHWRPMGIWWILGQVRWCLPFHWNSRWWTGEHCYFCYVDPCSPRHHLCPPRLQAHLPTTHQPLRSPRWLPMGRRNLRRR